ncbi:MAG: Type I Iterative PKS [Bathelium mastoideum]|nr:MAG: Type I Iterative PKS [Bathelium mastoideum]
MPGTMTYLPSLVVFGSLSTWPSVGEICELRRGLLEHKHLGHVKEVICKLPLLWEKLLANDACLEPIQGLAAAEQLVSWVSNGELFGGSTAQTNILSLPLTILAHLCQYMTYIQQTGSSHSAILDHVVKVGGVQGFCAGLLSALAVAGSGGEEEVGLYGAISVRLAFAIGAYVELDSIRNGQTSCLAVRWKSRDGFAIIRKVLGMHDSHVVRSNADGEVIFHDDAVMTAARDILVECSNWHSVISRAAAPLVTSDGTPFILAIGSDPVPLSISRNVEVVNPSNVPKVRVAISQPGIPQKYPENAVAIIGMSCKFPGADSPDEFWQLLINGTSMAEQVPKDRWSETTSARGNSAKGRFWGNFMRDIDLFDHRFFKKSSREAASMDPQQRLLLQGAYEAMQSAGYLSKPLVTRARDIGCYLGLCATDYDANVASHDPNAFSTLGTLRAFLSGKISHYFGWSGPSLTFDTACSSSAVAIHTACRALKANECTQALAGGAALFTSPYLYENLSAAHFLSPTGATKPFDANADGYCRGEGIGLVVLKKLSAAVAEGDDILAVIGGSAINQNDNCVPITVPHAPSEANLYRKVAQQAEILPHQVSFVESHGTGTPVGDPIEMDSIRTVFGGLMRDNLLMVSSVKGNIGHLEGASGVAGLIKAILQIEKRIAVMQASFHSLNPKIPPLDKDRITIPTSNLSLPDGFLSACVNNYGAAGSNSAMILMQPPRKSGRTVDFALQSKYPILITANSQASVVEYCRALRDFCQPRTDTQNLLGSIAFHLSRQQDSSLSYRFITCASEKQILEAELTRQLTESTGIIEQRPARPALVLVFGGQVRDYVGLNKQVWQHCAVLRFHLDRCDEILRSMGNSGLYPAIFQSEPISDLITLHSAIFALQYSSARAWIDCDLVVDALIGHSLGQLTALSISGMLTLEDGLKFIVGRASLMKTHWGPEPGAMIAVEADLQTLASVPHALEIACHNGPTSHVLVGDKISVEEYEETLSQKTIRYKRLQVTNGFHSKFTDPLIPLLEELASGLCLKKPTIVIETCSEDSSWVEPTAELLAKHTRDPVFFGNAVRRLAESRGPCTWLEVGSDSGITGMVRRALDGSDASKHGFQAVNLGKASALDSMVDATMQLWKRGHSVQFWNFHQLQRGQYETLRLPSYQWEKHRHWLELLQPSRNAPPAIARATPVSETARPLQLVRLIKHDSEAALFEIDPGCDEYKRLVLGHVVAGSPLCPATVYMEMVARACKLLCTYELPPLLEFSDLQIDSPLGMAIDRTLMLTLRLRREQSWEFKVASEAKDAGQASSASHAFGKLTLQIDSEAIEREFSRYERLTGSEAIEALYQDPDSEAIQGPMLYKMFSRVVEYGAPYRGLKSIAAKNHRIAGTVVTLPEFIDNSSLIYPAIVDSWMQISGIHANSIYPCPESEVYIFTKLDRLQFGPGYSPSLGKPSSAPQSWRIFSNLHPSGAKELANDIFVFDTFSKRLVVLILGARFSNVRLSSLSKVLSKVNNCADVGCIAPIAEAKDGVAVSIDKILSVPKSVLPPKIAKIAIPDSRGSIFNEVCTVFERVAEVPLDIVKGNMAVDDLGIDSLMMMEVISELSSHFSIYLPLGDMESLTDVDSLVDYLQKKGCVSKESSAPSSVTSASVQSSRFSVKSTPPSSGHSTTTDAHGSQQFEHLAKLLQEHLELASIPDIDSNLADLGLDSLLAIELASDIKKLFFVDVDLYQLDERSTLRDLVRLTRLDSQSASGVTTPVVLNEDPIDKMQAAHRSDIGSRPEPNTTQSTSLAIDLPDVREVFDEVRFDFDSFSKHEGFADFWRDIYPDQERLVLAYTADAFKKLGGDLASIPAGHQLPKFHILAKHEHLLKRMHRILADGGYIDGLEQNLSYTRTSKPFDLGNPQVMLTKIISKFPRHASEHRLLSVTASRLADCLTGKVDPLPLLFAHKANRQLLADVYDLAPMCRATTRLLASFLTRAFPPNSQRGLFHFLEVGGGTGGTTKFLVEQLTRCGIAFTYTFTDISSALVGTAKKELVKYDCMRYATLDVEGSFPPAFAGKFHAIISTNCIHATRNATASSANLRSMLRPDDGLLALVEFTNGLYWFDLVYGLLDGWWLFSDGRKHALADTSFWEQSLLAAGYQKVSWTDGSSPESRTLRLICGFNSTTASAQGRLLKQAGIPIETVVWKNVDGLELCADIYYPAESETTNRKKRPIALLFHGGGHVLFTRKDIHMKHVKSLLELGFVPVSVDYRLCPEVNLAQGPVTDACDALAWARSTLPHLQLARPDVQLDASRLAAVGWSAGGHLAMTMAYKAPAKGVQSPDVVLAFYCPSNFEAECWRNPIYPRSVEESPGIEYDLLEGIRDNPIAGYKPATALGAPMTVRDPRWRIVIHYNWKSQLVPVLVSGLPSRAKANSDTLNTDRTSWDALPMPATEHIQAVSPYAHIVQGHYRTPTFIVHGDRDELIPWQQSRDTIEALRNQGIEAGFVTPRGAGHAFDLWPEEDPQATGWAAVQEAYDFVCRHIF